MKQAVRFGACVISAGLFFMGSAMAQEEKGDSVTVTGCLVQGDHAGEYSITGDGKTCGLRSADVKLAEHLGHKVTITGKVSKFENPAKEQAKKEKAEMADLQVSNLTMVSNTCP